jgi:hypothetical protein
MSPRLSICMLVEMDKELLESNEAVSSNWSVYRAPR